MSSDTATLIIKALDCLSVRSIVTAQNIANAGTPNYRPLRVSFEQALADAASEGGAAVRKISPQVTMAPANEGGGELRLDMEMATESSTALRYGALIDVLDRQLQIQSLAITGSN